MSGQSALFPDCVLPGCRRPAVEGAACEGCRLEFGPYLKAPDEIGAFVTTMVPACGHGFFWMRRGRCDFFGCLGPWFVAPNDHLPRRPCPLIGRSMDRGHDLHPWRDQHEAPWMCEGSR